MEKLSSNWWWSKLHWKGIKSQWDERRLPGILNKKKSFKTISCAWFCPRSHEPPLHTILTKLITCIKFLENGWPCICHRSTSKAHRNETFWSTCQLQLERRDTTKPLGTLRCREWHEMCKISTFPHTHTPLRVRGVFTRRDKDNATWNTCTDVRIDPGAPLRPVPRKGWLRPSARTHAVFVQCCDRPSAQARSQESDRCRSERSFPSCGDFVRRGLVSWSGLVLGDGFEWGPERARTSSGTLQLTSIFWARFLGNVLLFARFAFAARNSVAVISNFFTVTSTRAVWKVSDLNVKIAALVNKS